MHSYYWFSLTLQLYYILDYSIYLTFNILYIYLLIGLVSNKKKYNNYVTVVKLWSKLSKIIRSAAKLSIIYHRTKSNNNMFDKVICSHYRSTLTIWSEWNG